MNYDKLLLAIICYLVSINSFSQERNDTFRKNFEVNGVEILKENYEIMLVDAIDTFLLAKLRPNNNYYFELLNSKSLKHITYIGRVGEGKNDFATEIVYNGQYEKINDQLFIWVQELNRKRLYRINITKSIKNGKTFIDKEIKYSPEYMFSQMFYIDSTNIIGASSNLDIKINRLLIINPQTNERIKVVKPFTIIKNDNNDINFLMYRYNMLYVAILALKPDKTKISSAMNMFNRLDIFDINGNILNSYIDKNENLNSSLIRDYLAAKQQSINDINVKEYYIATTSTDSYIYTVYYNQLKSEYAKQSIPVEVRVFDWQSEPVCSIKVPDYLQYITIDEKNGIMYGVAYFDEKILKYDISSILDEIKTGSK